MIEMGKEYRTRDGKHEVRIYATDAGGLFPIHGAVKLIDGTWMMTRWTAEGRIVNAFESGSDIKGLTDED